MSGDVIVLAVLVVLAGAFLHWLPTWRRRGFWFSVTVPEGFDRSPAAQSALRTYRTGIWILTLGVLPIVIAAAWLGARPLLAAGTMVQLIGAAALYAIVRRRILPSAGGSPGLPSAPLAAEAEGLPGGFASVLVPIGVLASTALHLHANWDRLPARVPVHWAFDGTPNRWADRSWHGVYGPLIGCALLSLFLLVMAEAIIHASPRARVPRSEAWTTSFRRANVMLLVAAVWGVSLMTSLFAIAPLLDGAIPPAVIRILPVSLVLAAIVPFTWQLIVVVRARDIGGDGMPDRCWTLGLLYYNPDDSALLVEKRFGVGYTFNFGNRILWWIAGVALLVVLVVHVAW